MQEYKPAMTCAEFHEQLPFLMDSGRPVEEEPHLRDCDNCRMLVRDLHYIADQAKLLLPMHDPSPRVWNNIQETLQKEGLSTEGRLPGPGQKVAFPRRSNWKTWTISIGVAAAFAVAIGLTQSPRIVPSTPVTPATSPAVTSEFDADDSQLLSQVEQRSPALRAVYEKSLRQVNAYISDAKAMIEQDPEHGREYLREAYAQKAMLYHMAAAHSFD